MLLMTARVKARDVTSKSKPTVDRFASSKFDSSKSAAASMRTFGPSGLSRRTMPSSMSISRCLSPVTEAGWWTWPAFGSSGNPWTGIVGLTATSIWWKITASFTWKSWERSGGTISVETRATPANHSPGWLCFWQFFSGNYEKIPWNGSGWSIES